MKKTQGGKKGKNLKPKGMSMGLEIIDMDDDNLNYEVEVTYEEHLHSPTHICTLLAHSLHS